MITNDKAIIRPYIESDLEQIAVIEKECFSQPWSFKALKEFTESAFSGILVLEYEGEVAGYITYTHIFEEISHFFTVYKQLEGKPTSVLEILGPEAAVSIIQESIDHYDEIFIKR